jgi:hypothetical protein
MTIEMRSTLDNLKRYASDLAVPEKTKTDETKRKAIDALSTLENSLKDKELDYVMWEEIYDTIHLYSEIDLTPKQANFFKKVQNVFSAQVNPNQKVQALCTFVNKKRAESISSQFKREEAKVVHEMQGYIQTLAKSKTETFSVSEVMQQIQENRVKNPRLFLSLKDEFNIFKGLLSERVKSLEKDPTSKSGELAHSLASLSKLSQLCQEEPFTLPSLVQKSEKRNQSGMIVLQPNSKDLDKAAIERLRMQRLFRLENLQETYQQSLENPKNEITSKFFDPTYAWYVGAHSYEEQPIELEMQVVGKKYGIQTISDWREDLGPNPVEAAQNFRTDLTLNCQLFSQGSEDISGGNLGEFNQDFVDFSKNGEVRIPRFRQAGEKASLGDAIQEFRIKRQEAWRKIYEQNPNALIPWLGKPFEDAFSLKAIALASSLNAVPVMNLTYNEGGNTLMGKNATGPYVIIGRDSVDVSKALMEKDLGHKMTEAEVRMAFAIDYGIKSENVFFVEQPGDFHLDMSMAIVGKNTVLLNDAVEAQLMFEEQRQKMLDNNIKQAKNDALGMYKGDINLQNTYVQEIAETLMKYTQEEVEQAYVRKSFEDITARDLEMQGFTVVRVPGRFHYSARLPAMNLFNFVAVQTPKGQNLVVMMGCIDDEYEKLFKTILTEHSDQEIDAFHFLNLQASRDCLARGGGISCRTKTISQ